MLALVYEPRRSGGRSAYVAWSQLTAQPVEYGKDAAGRQLWSVKHEGGLIPLPRSVKLEEQGQVFETVLRNIPPVQWGPRQRGSSVRPLEFADFCAVLTASGALIPETPQLVDTQSVLEVTQREMVAVSRLVRDRGFRMRVLSAYNWRCAVTGWRTTPDQAYGLLDAAHLRSVAQGGSDSVRNGLALTPTVHRLFDAGVLQFSFESGLWRLQRGAAFDCFAFNGPGGHMTLNEGQPLQMPEDPRLWPEPHHILS